MDSLTKRVQARELEILKSVADACEEMGLRYMIAYGTLLGAVRHKGFIPWDDDIDIWMPRDDYDVFLKEGGAHLPSHLMIQHFTTEPETNNIYIKIRDRHTVFLENDNAETDICHGMFIDVFPVERVGNSEAEGAKEFRRRKWFIIVNGCYDLPYVRSVQNPVKRAAGYTIHALFCRKKRSEFIAAEDARRLALHRQGGMCYLPGYFGYFGVAPYTDMDTYREYLFDGCSFRGPADGEALLAQIYGEYMTLPPADKQVTHKPARVEIDGERLA